MSSTEKNKTRQLHQVRLAMANFFSEVATTSTFTDLLTNYQDFFEVLMRADEADDADFRERAILMLHFCKSFTYHISSYDWQIISKHADKLKDESALKLLPYHEL